MHEWRAERKGWLWTSMWIGQTNERTTSRTALLIRSASPIPTTHTHSPPGRTSEAHIHSLERELGGRAARRRGRRGHPILTGFSRANNDDDSDGHTPTMFFYVRPTAANSSRPHLEQMLTRPSPPRRSN